MKKELRIISIVFLFTLLFLPQIIAIDEPSSGIGESDVEKLENLTEGIPINPETGEVDWGKLDNLKTQAEINIDKINAWIEEHAKWLGLFFGMVPEISWLFFINLWLMLFLIVHLVLNLPRYVSFFPNNYIARIIGLGIFIPLLIFKVIFAAAKAITHVVTIFWNVILPWGIGIALLIALVAIILGVFLLIASPEIVLWIIKLFTGDKEKRAKEKEKEDQETLGRAAEALREST